MIDFSLTETQRSIVDAARDFGRDVLEPAEIAVDRKPADQAFESREYRSAMASAFELGFHKMTLPEASGGLGFDPQTTGLVWEELARYGVGLAAGLMAGSVVPGLISFLAPQNKALVAKYVVPFCSDTTGTKITAWGSSEPKVGSDGKNYDDLSVHHETKASKNGSGYALNGAKSAFVSNGGVASALVVFASVDATKGLRGSGLFVIDGDAPGVTRGKAEDRIGLRALNQADLSFVDAMVPEGQMIFPPGDAYPALHHAIMTVGNLGTGYLAVGLMRAAYEEALAYAKARIQGGKPILEHQLVAKKLFTIQSAIESCRALLWKGSWHSAKNFPGDFKTSVTAKILCTTLAAKHTCEMVQVLGGYGITKDYKLEKYMRDAQLLTIMDGTNDTLMMTMMAHV